VNCTRSQSGKHLDSGLKLSILHLLNTGDKRDRWSKADCLLVFKLVFTLLSLVSDHSLLRSYPHY